MISSLITPVRWYSDIFESDRFSNDCDICKFELISDKTRLLPFQFRRPKSGYPIDKWILRKQCDDIYSPLFNTNDSLFTLNTGYWSAAPFTIANGKANFLGGPAASTVWKTLFTIGKYYIIKVVVSEFVKITPTFSFKLYYKTANKFDITEPGTYYISFLANTTDLVSVATLGTTSDIITFDSIEISEYNLLTALPDDIELPTSLLTVANINATEDVIQYVGDEFDFQIPCGKYFMLMYSLDDSYYASELITVKDFIPSQSPYTMIEWFNNCDLSDVFYQPVQGSEYFNRMYIDNEITKPIYPFKEEGEEDGNYKLNILFQKWEKQVSLMVANSPEFILDSLTTMRLHDTINITNPLRKKQIEVSAPFEIEKIETELTSIFNDCSTNCELKITLQDKIVDSTCCTNEDLNACLIPDHIFTEDLKVENGMIFGEPTMFSLPKSLYQVNDLVTATSAGMSGTYPIVGTNQLIFGGNITSNFAIGNWVRLTGIYEGLYLIDDIQYGGVSNETGVTFVGLTITVGAVIDMHKITLTDISTEGLIVQSNSIIYQYQSSVWEIISKITSFTFTPGSPDEFFIQGTTFLGIFVKFEFSTYDANLATTVITIYYKVYTAAQFKTGITVKNNDALVPLVAEGTITVKAICYGLNCPYADSNDEVIEFNP